MRRTAPPPTRRQKSNFASSINADSTVHPCSQKYFALPVGQIISIPSRHPVPDQEGRFAIVTKRWAAGCDGRGDVDQTSDITADGEVVWS
jgi:hypothetical protein